MRINYMKLTVIVGMFLLFAGSIYDPEATLPFLIVAYFFGAIMLGGPLWIVKIFRELFYEDRRW